MKDASEAVGPLRIVLSDGLTLDAAALVGGGTWTEETPIGDPPFYEVHFIAPDGGGLIVPQRDIRTVQEVATGEDVEFGNPYFPDHPRYVPPTPEEIEAREREIELREDQERRLEEAIEAGDRDAAREVLAEMGVLHFFDERGQDPLTALDPLKFEDDL